MTLYRRVSRAPSARGLGIHPALLTASCPVQLILLSTLIRKEDQEWLSSAQDPVTPPERRAGLIVLSLRRVTVSGAS